VSDLKRQSHHHSVRSCRVSALLVIPSTVAESLNSKAKIARDVSTSLDMTKWPLRHRINARIGFIAWKILPEKQDCERVVQNALQQLRLLPGVIELSIQHSCGGCERMHFGLVPIHYVNDFDPLDLQVIGNQTAMASPPYRFGAHDCDRTVAVCHFFQPCNSPGEFGCCHVVGVTAK